MDYKEKYLKYKSKYKQLQIDIDKENILFMFLGGLPSEDNVEIYSQRESPDTIIFSSRKNELYKKIERLKSLLECNNINTRLIKEVDHILKKYQTT